MTPCISSPLTVSSPVRVRRASTNLNTSPDTVPSRAPSLVIQLARRPEVRNSPVTLPPSCFKVSRMSSRPPAVRPTIAPYQEPLTFSVTRVRSIQSLCAQPSKNTTEIPQEHSREAPHRASSWRRFGPQDRVDAMERHPTVPATPEDLPAHVVAAHRELAAPRAPRRLEGEHITGHTPLDRKRRAGE